MIQPSVAHWQHTDWKNSLANAVRDPAELLQMLSLPDNLLEAARQASRDFPLRVPRSFVARMRKGDLNDPLLLQVLPLYAELSTSDGYGTDPVGDLQSIAAPGLLQKYSGRALLISTGACGIHCRYCFRRHFPYGDAHLDEQQWHSTLDYLRNNPGIIEIILSGGDPLVLGDPRLARLIADLENIPHLKRIRFHTRMPVILPERINNELLGWLENMRLKAVFVIHANHANEFDANVASALQALRACGATLLNQAVLLKKINDTPAALIGLSETLFDHNVQPYYLHLLDKVSGAGHFDVDEATAVSLLEACRRQLPGYLVPKLVREMTGAAYKLPIDGGNTLSL